MAIRKTKGDLIKLFKERHFDIIIHGCNCMHTLAEGRANGVAGQIGRQFPEAKQADASTDKGDVTKLGRFSLAKTKYGFIINAYTQFDYSKPYKREKHFEYSALLQLLSELFWTDGATKVDDFPVANCEGISSEDWDSFTELLRYHQPIRIGIPMIGAGFGGGDWNVIKQIIEYVDCNHIDLTIVEYQK